MHAKSAVWAMLMALSVATPARAYTYQSTVSKGCHERIVTETLRALRTSHPDRVPLVTPGGEDRALIHDLPFDLDTDVRDLTGASLAMGVRDNDLKGRGPNELDSIAQVHGDPALQREHCLRGPGEDEPDGTSSALENCKAFIREKVAAALEGLDQNGRPDANRKLKLTVTLDYRGQVDANLPIFWIEIGRALHALEDSFTHNYRSLDHRKVRVTTNYSDYVNTSFEETRDGPAHRAEMDECEGLDEYRAQNLQLAKQASLEVLELAVDPNLSTREAKMAALETTMKTYLDYEAGCTAANQWCNAKENEYAVDGSCSMTRSSKTSSAFALSAILGASLLLARRRRRASALVFVAALASPAAAQAQEEPTPSPAPPAAGAPAAPPPQHAPDVPPEQAPAGVPTKQEVVAEKRNEEHHESRFAVVAMASGSVSEPSLNGSVGGRVNLGQRWQVGLDGELNNWYGSVTKRFETGALNIYGTVVFRTPLRFADFNIRTTAHLGTSTLLIDLYGAPAGSTGLFFGFAPLGLEWKLSSRFFLVFNAISFALPVPKITSGAPFAYAQYRANVGIEIAL